MTVAQMCLTQSWGGLEMSTVKMARLFKAAGVQSLVFCAPQSPIYEACRKESIQTVEVKGGTYFSFGSIQIIKKALVANNVNCLYVHHLKDLWLLKPAVVGKNISIIGFARMFFKNTNKRDLLHRYVYSCLDHLIALSHIQKDYLLKCLPVEEKKYVVIPNGVDIKKFHPSKNIKLRAEWGVRDDEILIGILGRIDRQKGHFEFIESAVQVLKSHEKAKFVIIGADKFKLRPQLEKKIAENKIQDQIIFAGFRSDIPRVLNALDIFTMPSYEENFGNVVLEAMASGLPCLGTESGGTPEIINHQENGLLFEPKNSSAMAQALEQLLTDDSKRLKYGENARNKAEASYDIDKIFQRIFELSSLHNEL